MDAKEWTPWSAIAGAASTARNRPGSTRYLALVSTARRMSAPSTRSLASAARSFRGSFTSGGAISRRTICRLSASTRFVASRISPRGAGTTRSVVCWRSARARHERPWTSCTFAALTRIATANTASVACARPMRLERIMRRAGRRRRRRGGWRGALQEDLLVGRGDVHVQTLLGDGLQPLATRRVSNRRLQPDPLGFERVAPLPELSDVSLLPDAVDSPCYDARRDQDETNEHERDEGAAAGLYASLRHARNALSRALRARGLRAISSADAVSARRVSVSPSRRPRQVQIGCLGGQTQSALHSRKA